MARYKVRNLRSDDFDTIMRLERELFGDSNEGVLGPYYVRLCCDFFGSSCFLVEVEGDAVGYLLAFLRDREVYCTTLALAERYQGTRAIRELLRSFIIGVVDRADTCWFTVEEDNKAARALHAMLGAQELEVRPDFYGVGHPRIVSRIDCEAFVRVKARFTKLGLLEDRRLEAVA